MLTELANRIRTWVTTKLASYELKIALYAITNLTLNGSLGNFFISTISANASFSLSNIATGKVYYCMIKNSGASSITITYPNTADVKASATFTIHAGKTKEVSFIYDGTYRYWQVSEELT